MSFITYAELLKGAERSTRKPDVLRRLDQLTRQVPVSYPTDPLICRHYAEQNSPVSTRRARPSAPTLSESPVMRSPKGATLVTHNVREFERVQGLSVETWVD